MPTGIFEFQTMLTSAVSGISGSLLSTVQGVSYVLMTICLVLGIYEAYSRGGDLRSLAGALLKYAIAAFLIGNWTAFFSDAYSGFNQLASAIDSSYGAVDLAKDWTLQLEHLFQTSGYDAMFKAIPWTPSALITLVEIALAYIIYPIAVQIFALIYTFWGTCLFAMGPFVIALAPSSLINSYRHPCKRRQRDLERRSRQLRSRADARCDGFPRWRHRDDRLD